MNASLPSLQRQYDLWLASPHPVHAPIPVAGKQVRAQLQRARHWLESTLPAWRKLEQAWQERPERVWGWSDHHLFHDNIIAYSRRPFTGVSQMNAHLLAQAQRLGAEDWLIFAGDLALGRNQEGIQEWVAACPAQKVLILGNHDVRSKVLPQSLEEWQQLGFAVVADCAALPKGKVDKSLWLTHYPLPEEALKGDVYNFHGHVHQHSLPGTRRINLSVEALNYQPRLLMDLLS